MRPGLEAVMWWERRRVVFNLAVLGAGIASVATVLLVGARLVRPGEDVVEPLVIVAGVPAYALAANACYCLGWVSELLWSGGDLARTAPLRNRVFRVGLWFSVGVTLLPGVVVPAVWAIFGFHHAASPDPAISGIAPALRP
jgi:hypothetical protein